MSKPTLSIIIPTYNRCRRLDRALDNYTKNRRGDIEFVVSDNASTDNTREVVAQFQRRDDRIRYFRNRCNVGPNRNIFRAFLEIRADFFMILSDDDLVTDGFIDEMIGCIKSHPEAAVICHARRSEVSPGVFAKDFDCPREIVRYERGCGALCAVYARSSSISGITYNAKKVDADHWRLDDSIYPQVRLACMLAVEHPVVYVSSSESTLVPNNRDPIAKAARNRPPDMGVHERIEIACDVVSRLPWRHRFPTFQLMLRPIRDWSANLFVQMYLEDRRLAFTYLAALVKHPRIGTSARFWRKLFKKSISRLGIVANLRIGGLLLACCARSLFTFDFYRNQLVAVLNVNHVIKRITTRRFATRVYDKVAACFGRAHAAAPNKSATRDELIVNGFSEAAPCPSEAKMSRDNEQRRAA